MRSLIGRMVAVVLLAELVCAAALSGTTLLHERRTRLRAFDVMLQGRSDSVLGAIQDAEDPQDNVTIDPAELRLPPEDVYAVFNQGGRLLGSSANAPEELTARRGSGFSNRTLGRRRYRVFERSAMRVIDRAETGGVGLKRPVTIVYASLSNRIWHETREAAGSYLLASLALLMLTGIVMILLLRRVLRPIQDLAAEASAVSPRSLSFHAPESALQMRELRPLAETLTVAIGGLRQALENEHRFVSDAAHELKTSVAVVRSSIQLMMMRPRTPDVYAAGLERLLDDNSRVEELIARMLTLGRMEEAPPANAKGAVADLGVAVRLAQEKLRGFAEARAVRLTTEAQPGILVRTTPEKLDVLLSNLIVNAVQHSTPESSVQVGLEAAGEQAVLRVADTGSGIAPEALPHVFERFFREDRSRSRDTGGAGLGLAICKSIVEAAGGRLHIESRLHRGTTVSAFFTLA